MSNIVSKPTTSYTHWILNIMVPPSLPYPMTTLSPSFPLTRKQPASYSIETNP